MSRLILSLIIAIFTLPAFAGCDPAITISVTRPIATEAEPAVVSARATSGCPVTLMRVYVDNKRIYEQHGPDAINARLIMGAGTHHVVIQAWNSAGKLARDERVILSTRDPVEPITGCEYGDATGAFYGGDQVPYSTNSPFRVGMAAITSGAKISSIRLYIDGINRAQTYGANAYCLPVAFFSAKPGTHFINVEAWDTLGHIRLTGSIVQITP
jgi:hypothetical protein